MTKRQYNFALLLIAGITLGAFWQVLHNGFITYDDPLYITGNRNVVAGINLKSVRWALSSSYAFNWHPVTWICHMLDVQLFGFNPAGHHLTSLLIHITNSILLGVLLQRLTGRNWQSLAVTLLFAIHPMHVESVAWAAEKKDLLSGFFWMLTILAYSKYVQRPQYSNYLFVLLFFSLGLMSKSMLVTLPVILLLLDYWPLARREGMEKSATITHLIVEKIPLFMMSAVAGVITLVIQKGNTNTATLTFGTLSTNLIKVVNSYVYYIVKLIWPSKLAIIYPFDISVIPLWQSFLCFILLVTVTVSVACIRKQKPHYLIGWLWFMVTLLPVSGIVSIGSHFIADRYSYIPFIGLFIMAVWGISDLIVLLGINFATYLSSAFIAFGILFVLTYSAVLNWKDSITLYNHAIESTVRNWICHNNLGVVYLNNNDYARAMDHFRKAVQINKKYTDAYINIGAVQMRTGDYSNAIDALKYAIKNEPDNIFAHFNIAQAYLVLNDVANTTNELNVLKSLSPGYASQLAYLMKRQGI